MRDRVCRVSVQNLLLGTGDAERTAHVDIVIPGASSPMSATPLSEVASEEQQQGLGRVSDRTPLCLLAHLSLRDLIASSGW